VFQSHVTYSIRSEGSLEGVGRGEFLSTCCLELSLSPRGQLAVKTMYMICRAHSCLPARATGPSPWISGGLLEVKLVTVWLHPVSSTAVPGVYCVCPVYTQHPTASADLSKRQFRAIYGPRSFCYGQHFTSDSLCIFFSRAWEVGLPWPLSSPRGQ
jgi:hypothetical protein